MNKLSLLLIVLVTSVFSGTAWSQTQIEMGLPVQTSTFTGNVRGYYFVAPTCFTITGAMVAVEAGAGDQSIAIVRFNNTPPLYSATTNDFTVLYVTQNNTNAGILPLSIQVEQGDIIGVLGQRGTINSYGTSGYTTPINGFNTTLNRLGMQFSLTNTAPQQLWTENGGSISRVNLYYDSLITYNFASTVVTPGSYTFDNGADTSFVSAWDYGDGSPLDTTDSPAHTYLASGSYTVCSYITTSCGTDTVCGVVNVCFPATITQSIAICDGASYSVGSSVYTAAGSYTDSLVSAFGCDSIVETNLSLLPHAELVQDISFCQGDSLIVGTNSYFASGTYNDTLVSLNGCDSVVVSNVTVLMPSGFTQDVSVCFGESFAYNNNTYSATGQYIDVFTNAAGCDSTVTTNLTVAAQVPTTVQVTGITMNAPAGFQYQWINCAGNTPIAGATSAAFTPTQNGQYAVVVTSGNCSDTSACTAISTIGLEENWLDQVVVFPNPVKDVVTIELNDHQATIVLRDVYGNVLYNGFVAGTGLLNMTTYARGVYFLTIRTQQGVESVKEIIRQ